ncbi:MAG TPA: hypothetical protein VJ967_00280 [Clostridia bacterium]|nr:hypothetical protein [Clostridia bacterium]
MSTVNNGESRIKNQRIPEDEIIAYLLDAHTISAPLPGRGDYLKQLKHKEIL